MPVVYLTREDIISTTGAERPEELDSLEVLFLTFDEIAALQCCPNLRKLTLLDNGLRKISNLNPVSLSLQVLCLCDQNITDMENLHLPQLRELYLHRNQIRRLQGLEGCPRLRKLWLFQNRLTEISGLHAVPELEECWLQANEIVSLDGLQHNAQLTNLGLAGNKVRELREVRKLLSLPKLTELSFTDIHFGRCPIVDEDGYREYTILQLKQVRVLDGVKLKAEAVSQAEDLYYQEMVTFNNSLAEIEEAYQKQLRGIELQHQSRESYSQVLEKEMGVALKELQGLVDEGRKIVKKEVEACDRLLDSNLTALTTALQQAYTKAESSVASHASQLRDDYQAALHLTHLLELVEQNHILISQLLNDTQRRQPGRFAYQQIGHNAADFLMLATLLDASRQLYPSGNPSSGKKELNSQLQDLQLQEASESTKNTPRNRRPNNSGNNSSSLQGADDIPSTAMLYTRPLELARLYRLYQHSSTGTSHSTAAGTGRDTFLTSAVAVESVPASQSCAVKRLFTLLHIDAVQVVLTHGWTALTTQGHNVLFSDDADLLISLYEDHAFVTSLQYHLQPEIVTHSQEAETTLQRVIKGVSLTSKKENQQQQQQQLREQSQQAALLGKAVMLLSVLVPCNTEDWTLFDQAPTSSAVLPLQAAPRNMFLEELLSANTNGNSSGGANKPRRLLIRNRAVPHSPQRGSSNPTGSNTGAVIYVVPCTVLAQPALSGPVILEYLCLAIHHSYTGNSASSASSGGGSGAPLPLLKNLEGRLEVLLFPSHHLTASSSLLATYEHDTQTLLQHYVEQLLEGIDASQAQMLRQTEQEVGRQEAQLRGVREEIERERKAQETQLRELRVVAGGEGGMQNSNSAAKVGQQQPGVSSKRR